MLISCLVPVPKKGHPSTSNDYKPVVLTSHLIKFMERLILSHLWHLVKTILEPLSFAYQPEMGVESPSSFFTMSMLTWIG